MLHLADKLEKEAAGGALRHTHKKKLELIFKIIERIKGGINILWIFLRGLYLVLWPYKNNPNIWDKMMKVGHMHLKFCFKLSFYLQSSL